MKKIFLYTFLTIGVAHGAQSVTFDSDAQWTTNNLTANGQAAGTDISFTLADDSVLSVTMSEGRLWENKNHATTWTGENTIVFSEILSFVGLNSMFDLALDGAATGSETGVTSYTLKLSDSYKVGDSFTLYLGFYAQTNFGKISGFNFDGLTDATYSYSKTGGSGWSSSPTYSATSYLTFMKIEGKVSESPITFSATGGKASLSFMAYSDAIPEPATATLSLLALAGLAARRRRK